MVSIQHCILFTFVAVVLSVRDFRTWSTRTKCEVAEDPNYLFAYSKYPGQIYETKGRVNSNKQDQRHECQVKGGASKCHICEDFACDGDTDGICFLQLQGVNGSRMAINVPVVSDTPWAVGGEHRKDFGGANVTHFCVFTTGGECILPQTTDFSACTTRCFGFNTSTRAVPHEAHNRTIVDVYTGMFKWPDDGNVDLWEYPRNCDEMTAAGQPCRLTGSPAKVPSFNPQGYVFTLTGHTSPGFVDGDAATARFNSPHDLSVDEYGNIFVADTQNHAIRLVDPQTGAVSTVAGGGADKSGFLDGPCSEATFANPKGLEVFINKTFSPHTTVIIVADTGNHRIRRIDFNNVTGSCHVRCLSGLCGNNTISATDFKTQAVPQTGYADGDGLYTRFSSPESVTLLNDLTIVVADTGNFLIRLVNPVNGTTVLLAGSLTTGQAGPDGLPLPGCTPPCMVGVSGLVDGNLTHAKFHSPVDITRGMNNSLYVTDENRIRLIELPNVITSIYTIQSMGRVSTIAGNSLQGHEDGRGDEATFFVPTGVFVTNDDIAYVTDAASCRVRRLTPLPLVTENMQCTSRAVELIRPSGCTSFDQQVDLTGRKISRVEKNIQYNYGSPYYERGDLDRGKFIKNCVAVSPPDTLDKHFLIRNVTGDNLVIDDRRVAINEDSEEGMAAMVHCPASCIGVTAGVVEGNTWYSEKSSVCRAAIHMGVLTDAGGYMQITYQRRDFINGTTYDQGTTSNGITSTTMSPDIRVVPRVFTMETYNVSTTIVHTVAGVPSAMLSAGCGYSDGQPSMMAKFHSPQGISAGYNTRLTDKSYAYIADTSNNMIRAMSAVCTQICENGGRCVGPDTCSCPDGWLGVDCTTPICTSACGTNRVCAAPDTCVCKPGYTGANCDVATCTQSCRNGGFCAFPDTCQCTTGWFDTNCTTPVCTITCGNGGNCVAPDVCRCPAQWTGPDCRTPVCTQACENGGYCVAPDTCICTPQWIGVTCNIPVCSQGFFKPNGGLKPALYSTNLLHYPTYKPCNLQGWCNSTNEMECDQLNIEYIPIEVPSGPDYLDITGRKVPPVRCMNIELPITYKIPYELLHADGSTTGYTRYSPVSPYQSNEANEWRGYEYPEDEHTGPWEYTADRQLAYVDWLNVSQGVYVCANGGNCISPDVCECATGWGGFDCRTPICNQGYYFYDQETYVSGEETTNELSRFEVFLGNNTYRLDWPYSNPNYTMIWENYLNNGTDVMRKVFDFGNKKYLYGADTVASNAHGTVDQGGYRCSIRSVTKWENLTYTLSHPNYYSKYMDLKVQNDGKVYSYWEDMLWPPVTQKSLVLDQYELNRSFIYTNEGYRRWGIWNVTQNVWEYGICLMEFVRTCRDAPEKQFDIESGMYNAYVQDTDLAFRARLQYDDLRVTGPGRWVSATGECIDEVVRGCYNNGTCIAPNTCRCAPGWSGYDCTIPVCDFQCLHNGNCTLPNTCSCEKGWEGEQCQIPICAQQCMNKGVCVAPDTCQCLQWENTFRDSRVGGGRPLYMNPDGTPRATGWTGYDCATPICVQSEHFLLNVDGKDDPDFVSLGGHGGDGTLSCIDPFTGLSLPRCPQYDVYVSGNEGATFQVGCGYDPYDTGCCTVEDAVATCYACAEDGAEIHNETYYCHTPADPLVAYLTAVDTLKFFKTDSSQFAVRICDNYHSPRNYINALRPIDYGESAYFVDILDAEQSSFNYLNNYTSNRFLCNVREWLQGDFVDDAGMSDIVGVGTTYGLEAGRHVRVNYPNLISGLDSQGAVVVTQGPKVRGEGIYECFNAGSCLGPDYCSCTDGYEGFDCNTPMCRHLQPTGDVSACLNGGVCSSRDNCDCIQVDSVLWLVHEEASRTVTGWTGTDCSMPMCSQGYFDPFCTNLPQAPGGEGCFRCANGGNCTAPDVCVCANGWTGYDCKTPVCETVADPLTRSQLPTVYEDKVLGFEKDPCGVVPLFGWRGFKGTKYSRGNCTQPSQCTCMCKVFYNKKACTKTGTQCEGPWQDPMVASRNVLVVRGIEYTFGSTDCAFGYEGKVDDLNRFTTCHQTIYVPTATEKSSVGLIVGCSIGFAFFVFGYYFLSVRLKRKYLLDKIARRRSKRSSEESLLKPQQGAFGHK